jgi:hypothetical protein
MILDRIILKNSIEWSNGITLAWRGYLSTTCPHLFLSIALFSQEVMKGFNHPLMEQHPGKRRR